MASLLTQCKAAGRIALYLVIAYVAISLWQDPAGSAAALRGVVASIGHFFAGLIDRLIAFGRALAE